MSNVSRCFRVRNFIICACSVLLFLQSEVGKAQTPKIDPEVRKAVRLLNSPKQQIREDAIASLIKLAEDGKPVIEVLSSIQWKNEVAHASASEVVRQIRPELGEAFRIMSLPASLYEKLNEVLKVLIADDVDVNPILPLLIATFQASATDTIIGVDGASYSLITSDTWYVNRSTSLLLARCAGKDQRALKSLAAVAEMPPPGGNLSNATQTYFEARYAATAALGLAGEKNPNIRPSILPVLQRAFLETESPMIFVDARCIAAMKVLGKYGSDAKNFVPAIHRLTTHRHLAVRNAATDALKELGI